MKIVKIVDDFGKYFTDAANVTNVTLQLHKWMFFALIDTSL